MPTLPPSDPTREEQERELAGADFGLGLGPRLPLVLGSAEAFFLRAQPLGGGLQRYGKAERHPHRQHEVRFRANAQVTVPGSYAVAVSAVTVSGDTSTLSVPLRVN